MRFRAELRNIRTFSKLIGALNSLGKIVWVRLENGTVRFIVVPDKGSEVWSTFHCNFLFDNYVIQSIDENNRIDLELPLASLQRAIKSALDSSDANLRLCKRDGAPFLSMTIHTMGNARGGLGLGGSTGATFGGASGRRMGNFSRESTFGEEAAQQRSGREQTVELAVKREREKVVVQDIPVRILAPNGQHTTLEPTPTEADVNIVLPPLLQLKAVSDRFTKLAHAAGAGGSSGSSLLAGGAFGSLRAGGGTSTGFGTVGGGGGATGSGGSGPRLELSANMYGTLRLRLVTDTLSVETVWNDLENPPMNEAVLPMPLAEHPSTKFREAGPDKFATVLVDGRDWSRVLGVGRLDGRVIACFNDSRTLVLHVYVTQPDDLDDPEETSSITYYVTSYSS